MDEPTGPDALPEKKADAEGQKNFPGELIEDLDNEKPAVRIESLYSIITRMGVSDRIKLALIGNREARSLLIKDANKIVLKNILENPRLTEDEVLGYVTNKNLSSEVPRLVAIKKEFLKSYQIRLALVSNPKTPVAQVLKLMPGLRENDLKQLARSVSVPGVVKVTARKMLGQRGKSI